MSTTLSEMWTSCIMVEWIELARTEVVGGGRLQTSYGTN